MSFWCFSTFSPVSYFLFGNCNSDSLVQFTNISWIWKFTEETAEWQKVRRYYMLVDRLSLNLNRNRPISRVWTMKRHRRVQRQAEVRCRPFASCGRPRCWRKARWRLRSLRRHPCSEQPQYPSELLLRRRRALQASPTRCLHHDHAPPDPRRTRRLPRATRTPIHQHVSRTEP